MVLEKRISPALLQQYWMIYLNHLFEAWITGTTETQSDQFVPHYVPSIPEIHLLRPYIIHFYSCSIHWKSWPCSWSCYWLLGRSITILNRVQILLELQNTSLSQKLHILLLQNESKLKSFRFYWFNISTHLSFPAQSYSCWSRNWKKKFLRRSSWSRSQKTFTNCGRKRWNHWRHCWAVFLLWRFEEFRTK